MNEMKLVYSHGDLWEGNLLISKFKKPVIIDWETGGLRSLYFDFYYFMFMLASKKNSFGKVDKEEIKMLHRTLNYIIRESQISNKNNLNIDIEIYRYLFYIELIKMKLEEKKRDMNKQEVMTWIKRFKAFEAEIIRCK